MAIVCAVFVAYYVVLFARIILSWTTMFGWSPPPALTPAIRVVYDLTEPIMQFFRRFIPPMGGLDISVIFIFIILRILQASLGCG
ncbi:MAG: YggT family protein [Actinobacteria bacterium]|nr:YggT family protein [Actinomycetota bacterium]